MTPAEKVLVQQTFAKLVPIADQAAALFVKAAWTTVYTVLATTMKAGARG